MGSDNTPQCSETEKITVSEYHSEEYIVCPVCGHVSRRPGAICPNCSNYLFAYSGTMNVK